MKKILTFILSVIMVIGTCVTAFAATQTDSSELYDEITIQQEVENIYVQKIIEAGLAEDSDKVNFINGVAVYSDETEKTFSEINAYIEVDGVLEDAYNVIYRNVATGMTGTLTNTRILGFTITVNYSYYKFSADNGYIDPYYRHGELTVKASTSSGVESIDNFRCVYLSRGIQTDSSGNWTGNFVEAISRINAGHLSVGERWSVSGSNIGKPYIAKYSSTVENGTAFTGVAYAFEYGGNVYSDNNVFFYDESAYDIDYDEFDWDLDF